MLGFGRIDQTLNTPHHPFGKDAVSRTQHLRVSVVSTFSALKNISSYNFSPGRMPVNLISMFGAHCET